MSPPRARGRRAARATGKAWSGRFETPTAPLVEAFTTSLAIDRRLYPYDVRGSLAHVRGLVRAGLLSAREGVRIERGLRRVERELDGEAFEFLPSDEDIHMAIERRLTELVGPVGGKLHTGRSRNDQVALDFRLWILDACERLATHVTALEHVLVDVAERNVDVVMPGYTHLQRAQPVLVAHHLLAYREMLRRDRGRLEDCRARADELPLGAGALAGAGFGIDRRALAKDLGFARVARNSLDAVADRDAAAELLGACAILAVHLSRFGEEIVLWASDEFGFVELPDAFATGSSMMPQKKNPDVAELVRGRAGGVIGALVALLTTLKGLPLAYNRDLQEDKGVVFGAVDTTERCVEVMAAMVPALRLRPDRMLAASDGLTLATDVADRLVERGIPFRQAHEIVGALVRHCLATGTHLRDVDARTLRGISPALDRRIVADLTPATSLARRRAIGGTAPREVRRQLARARRELG